MFVCPPDIPVLQETLRSVVAGVLQDKRRWYVIALAKLKRTQAFNEFARKRDGASSLAELLDVWRRRRESTLRYHVREDWVGAIIYRFSHAADPDRGIITFISALLSSRTKVYGIYNIVRRAESFRGQVTDVESYRKRVDEVLAHDGAPIWLRQGVAERLAGAKSIEETFDAQRMWEDNIANVRSKVYKTLAYFTDGIYLGRGGALLTWNRWKLLGVEGEHDITKFFDVLRRKLGFDQESAATPIKPVTEGVVEDEVTYAIVHRVLLPHKFRIVAVSYPGAQGGYAVLPEQAAGRGRAQKRIYHDVTALPPDGENSFDALLNESKGEFSQAEVEVDVAKLLLYKQPGSDKDALQRMLVRAQVVANDHKLETILIGVSFGVGAKAQSTWNPGTVDFVFCVVDRERWRIGIFNPDLLDVIRRINGTTDFPQCFMLGEPECQNPQLFQ